MPEAGEDPINGVPYLVRCRGVGITHAAARFSGAVRSTYFGVRAFNAMSVPAAASAWIVPLPMPRPVP
jgi:hypothetical protein